MKKFFLILLFLNFLSAENLNEFENQMSSSYQQFLTQQQEEFKSYKVALNKGFKEYKEALEKGFADYRKELGVYWEKPELTTKKSFVEYSKDKKVRKKVDYEKGEIVIDVITDNQIEAKRKFAKALLTLTTETAKDAFEKNLVLKKVNQKLVSNPQISKIIKNSKPTEEPIVADMIFKKPPTTTELKNYTITKVKSAKIEVKKSKLPHLNQYRIRIKLPPKSFLAKAKIYKNDVFRRSHQFHLIPELVYGIIHTESSFNPMARSYIPAFGLMQIVPQSAGADAYKMLYGKKKILTPSYLYNAKNNILIGSAYLKKIYYIYMRKIKNPLSRLYCTIAAYNTGAGNVACAFNSTTKDYSGKTKCVRSRGDYSIIKASDKINSMTPQQVYNHLLQNLRYDEPKNYLKRVTKRIYIYKKALTSNAI